MEDLAGKVVVITGGASGIGRGIAEAFADQGARLVLVDMNEARLADMVDLLADKTELMTQVVDLRDSQAIEQLAADVYEKFGQVNVLCNNAGVACSGLIWEQSEADWEWIFDTNVRSIVQALRVFVPRMLEQGQHAHIVNTSSMLGLSSAPLVGLYGASKQAVLGITEALRMELQMMGADIAVSVLCPGPVQTNAGEEPGRPQTNEVSALPGEMAEMDAMLKAVVADGMSPRQVGDCVVNAVRGEEFWILPAPDLSHAEQRLAEIRAALV